MLYRYSNTNILGHPPAISGRRAILIAWLITVELSAGAHADTPYFEPVGTLPGANFGSTAIDISEDGSTVLGNSDEGLNSIAFLWSDGVIVSFGHLDDPFIGFSEAGGVSADGQIASGMSFSANGTEAFRWSAGQLTGIGDLTGGVFYSHAFEISGDGNVVVGLSRTETGDYPFRWANGVMTNLSEDLAEELADGFAKSISDDGQIIVGGIVTSQGFKIFRWQDDVMTPVDIPTNAVFASADSLSADGSVMVGNAGFVSGGSLAFRWQNGAYQLLGDLPGGSIQSAAYDVSADGSVVVGDSAGSNGLRPFIWDAQGGMRDLDDILRRRLKLNLDGWTLSGAVGVSGDGRTVAGNGVNPEGKREAWIAHIGCGLADVDNDGDADLIDHASFADCLAGPASPPNPLSGGLTEQSCLAAFDIDCNNRVDLADAAIFQRIFDGD